MSAPLRALTLLSMLLPASYDATKPALDEEDEVGGNDRFVSLGTATLILDRETNEVMYDQPGASFGDDDELGDDDLGFDEETDDEDTDELAEDDDLGDEDEMAGRKAKQRRLKRKQKQAEHLEEKLSEGNRRQRRQGHQKKTGLPWQPWVVQNDGTSDDSGTLQVDVTVQSRAFEPEQVSFDGCDAALRVKSIMAGDDPVWSTEGKGIPVATFQANSRLGANFFKAKKLRLGPGMKFQVVFTTTAADQSASVSFIGRRLGSVNCN